MVFHEADDHESDEPRTSPPGRILPFASRKQPDWLTGPDDDLGGALDGMKAGAPAEALPSPVLLRPAARASDRGAVPESDYIAPGKPAADSGPAPVHPAGAWAPAASSVPSLKLVLPMEPGRDEEEPVPGRPARIVGLPGHQEDHPYGASAPPPALKPLEEPWWVIALDTLRTSLPVQVAVAGALVGSVLLAYWM